MSLRAFLPLPLALALCLTGCQRAQNVPAALPAASAPQDTSATARLRTDADALLALHRQIIVLMDGEAALPAAQRREVQRWASSSSMSCCSASRPWPRPRSSPTRWKPPPPC